MSFTFNTMQRAIATLDGDKEVIKCLQQSVARLHELAHQGHNELNHDDILRDWARALKAALDAQDNSAGVNVGKPG